MTEDTCSQAKRHTPRLLTVLYAAAIAPAIFLFIFWAINTFLGFPLTNYSLTLYLAGSPLGLVPTFAIAFANNVLYGLPLLILAKRYFNIRAITWLPIFALVGYLGGNALYWFFTFPHEFISGYPYGLLGVSSSTAVWFLGIYRETESRIQTHNKRMQSDAAEPRR